MISPITTHLPIKLVFFGLFTSLNKSVNQNMIEQELN